MKRLICILVLVALAISVSWSGWWVFLRPQPDAAQASGLRAQMKVVGRTVVERGVLVSLDTTPVLLGASGELLQVVETGTYVDKGQVIVRSDDEEVREELEDETFGLYDAEQELAAAEANYEYIEVEQNNRLALLNKRLELAQLEEKLANIALTPEERRQLDIELEIAKLDLKDAEEELERQQRLFDKEFISEAMLEPYRRRAETARAAVKEVKERIKLEEKGRPREELLELRKRVERIEAELARGQEAKARRLKQEKQDIAGAEAHVERHRQEKARKEEDLTGTVVKAADDGIMSVRVYHSRGSGWVPYGPGIERYKFDHIADIVNPGRMKAEFMIHEADVEFVSEGLAARVRIPAYGNREFVGTVTEVGGVGRDRADVAPLGYESGKSGITMFNASVSLEAQGLELRPGMSAVIEVIVEEPRPRLVIPRAALVQRDGRFFVRSPSGRKWEEQEVRGYILDTLYFVVEDGLEDGDVVLSVEAAGDAS